MEQIVRELSGFSGCKIFLMQDEQGKMFVRKISKSEDYNDRMKKQGEKQSDFYNNLQTRKIKTPKILKDGFIDGKYYFDMEYVTGVSLVRKIEDSNLEQLKSITYDLIEIINLMKSAKNKENKIFFKELIVKKLQGILLNESAPPIKNLIITTISLAEENLILDPTFCHGDLTLENIIYNEQEGSYYLIDFLDSFIDHYWQDIAKLFQDLEGQWYLFRNPDINRTAMEIKTEIIRDILIKELLAKDDYIKNHALLLATTFCRILPYANEKEKGWIQEKISKSTKSNIRPIL